MKNSSILIGWATTGISPRYPINLGGQMQARISKGILDPITATALVISSENKKEYVMFISCDVCTIRQEVLDRCRAGIKEQLPEIDVERIVMNATHTHTAPDLQGSDLPTMPNGVMSTTDYIVFLVEKISKLAYSAWKDLKCGGVSWIYGNAVVSHNRRAVYFDDLSKRIDYKYLPGMTTERFARMYGNTNDIMFSHIEGYEDHSLNVLCTWDSKNKLTGLVINLPCPAQVTEGLSQISADFWNETRNELRKRFGKSLQILAQTSAAGDQSPHLLIEKKATERMLKLKKTNLRKEIAERITRTISEIVPYAKKDIKRKLLFKHNVKNIEISRRIILKDEFRQAQEDYDVLKKNLKTMVGTKENNFLEESFILSVCARCRRLFEKYQDQKKGNALPIEIHAIRLGDIVFVTNRFELYLDYGMRIKARSKALQTFIIQLAGGGKYTGTYLPTARAEAGQSYGACMYSNEVGSKGGQELVEATLEAIEELWE